MCFYLLHAHYMQRLQKRQTHTPVFNQVFMDVEIVKAESQNPRTVCIGRDLNDCLVLPPLP